MIFIPHSNKDVGLFKFKMLNLTVYPLKVLDTLK